MFTLIQKRYDFTNYQIAQLKYTFTILFSELSKFVLISFFYRNQLGVYLYALILLSVLRLSTGGLHAKTYWGCFLMSFIFFWLAIKLLPQIDVPKVVMVILIISGMAAIYRIGPVASVFRMQPEGIMKKRLIVQSLIVIMIHLILFCIFDSKLLTVGSWINVLQTCQLIAAKFSVHKEVK